MTLFNMNENTKFKPHVTMSSYYEGDAQNYNKVQITDRYP